MNALALMLQTALAADRPRTLGTFAVGAFESLCRVSFAWWFGLFVAGAARGDLGLCLRNATGYGVTLALVGVSNMFRVNWTSVLQEKVAFRLDVRLMNESGGVPEVEHHERPAYLDRMALIREERAELGQAVWPLVGLAQSLVALVAAVVLLGTVTPWLMLLLTFAVPSVVANRRIAVLTAAAADRSAVSLRRAQHLSEVGASPGAGKEIRVFGLQAELLRRYAQSWGDYDRTRSAAERTAAVLGVGGLVMFGLGYTAALLVAVVSTAGESTATRLGMVALTFALASQVNQLVTSAGASFTTLSRALAGYDRLRWLLRYAAVARRAQTGATGGAPTQLRHGISFHHVDFRYPGSDRLILDDVDLAIPAGSTVAIVGDNGAGKSTLVKLLGRYYRPSAGAITVDGVDLATIDVERWRLRLSGGFQDFMRFEFRAMEAVGVGDLPRLDEAEAVRTALGRAHAADVLDRMPSGLDTQLGSAFSGGVDLSGGQWQKLALGRAMMRDEPLLLLLDEPTASLDADTEHRLFTAQAEAARLVGDRTGAITVLVSHRFSTTLHADLIVVVQGGRIAQRGTHDELMQAGGLYAELFALQADAYR